MTLHRTDGLTTIQAFIDNVSSSCCIDFIVGVFFPCLSITAFLILQKLWGMGLDSMVHAVEMGGGELTSRALVPADAAPT